MSKPTLFIDNVSIAKKNELLQGDFTLEAFPRLLELLSNSGQFLKPSGSIFYKLQGETNRLGQQILHLNINANLATACQRCLNEMPLSLNLNFKYLIGDVSDNEFEVIDVDNSDDFDLQQASQTMDVIALIEDEIIIAIPISPMHEDTCKELVTQSGEKTNPFAVLKRLIKS